jgi:hypothetical protein
VLQASHQSRTGPVSKATVALRANP